MADATTPQAQAPQGRSKITLAARHQNPEDMVAASELPHTTLFGILAIVATLLFVVVLLMLWKEHTALIAV